MARLPRLYVPGCSHHIIQRGNNRTACFFDNDQGVRLLDLKFKMQIEDVANRCLTFSG